MKNQRCKWLSLMVLSIATLLVMGGCSGSSSSTSNNGNSVGKATISGAVSFPSMGSLVSKRAGAVVADPAVTVKAYTIDGKEVASVNPTYDDTTATRVYAYTIANLDPGVDYVIKVSKGGTVLKKLIEKKVVSGTLVGQNINSVSTAAVIVASKQLGAVLGDVLPAGKTASGLSTSISTDIKPGLLEDTINAVVSGGRSGVTDSNMAAFANIYNIVVTAGSEGVDPALMFTANPPALASQVPILTVAAGTSVATVIQTTVDATVITNNAAPTYTPPTTTELAATYNSLAKINLTAQDISNAALNYEKALSIDPNDPEANFGGAITSGMMMIEDPDVQAIITKWGAVVPTVNQIVQGTSPIKLPFGNLTSIKLTPKTVGKSVGSVTTSTEAQKVLAVFSELKAKLPQQKTGFKSLAKTLNLVPATAPSISEMQTLIDNVIIPKIDTIITRLAKAETTSFSFIITKAMQGNPVNGLDVTLNAGELYTLDAALNIFQIMFKIASSYNFDIPSPYTYDTIGQDPLAMINSSTVFTLKATGPAKMAGALDNAKAAAAKAKLAYDTVVTRTVGVGMFDLTNWTQLEKDDFVNDHAKVTAALAGQYDVLDKLGAKIVTIDATKFFTNPLTRTNLPTFGYDVPRDAALSAKYGRPAAAERTVTNYFFDGINYIPSGSRIEAIESNVEPTSDIPDYTLNGILPGNTAANNVARFNGILPVKGGVLIHGSVNGVSNYDISEPNRNLSYESDGTSLYRLKQTVVSSASSSQLVTRIQQIDTTTGLVTNKTTVNNNVSKIVYVNGQWLAGEFVFDSTGKTFNLYKFTDITATPWTLSAIPEISIPLGFNSDVQAISGAGNIIYYVLTRFDNFTKEIHKLDVTTSVDTLVNSGSNWINAIEFFNGNIYTSGGDGIEKRDATTGAVVASYANGDFKAMLGGFFYTNNNGKLIKYAGVPAGGAAKAALAKYFGF